MTHDESLDLQEAYVKALLQGVLDRAQALETLERDTELLKRYIAEPFKRITYDQAIDLLLQEHENDEDADYEHLEHGDDFVHHMKLDFKPLWCANFCHELSSSH